MKRDMLMHGQEEALKKRENKENYTRKNKSRRDKDNIKTSWRWWEDSEKRRKKKKNSKVKAKMNQIQEDKVYKHIILLLREKVVREHQDKKVKKVKKVLRNQKKMRERKSVVKMDT